MITRMGALVTLISPQDVLKPLREDEFGPQISVRVAAWL